MSPRGSSSTAWRPSLDAPAVVGPGSGPGLLFLGMAVLLFFPSVTFGVLTAEIFPWALGFAALYSRQISAATLLLVGVLSLSALTVMEGSKDGDASRSLAAYLNFILPFACFLHLPSARLLDIRNLARVVLIVLIVLGLLQLSGIIGPLEPLLAALVPRARGASLIEAGGRGVTLFSSEPARAGMELGLLYFVVRITSKSRDRLVIWDLLFPVYVALVIRSASAMSLTLICLALLVYHIRGGWFILLIPLAGVAVMAAPSKDNRALALIGKLASVTSFSDGLFLLANESGHRLVAFYAFIAWGLEHPFGSGVGNWGTSSTLALNRTGIDFSSFSYFQAMGEGGAVAVRAPGVIANLMLDVGIVGTIVFLAWLFLSSRHYLAGNKIAKVTLVLLLLKITFFGSVGEPLPWLVFALALRLPELVSESPELQHA